MSHDAYDRELLRRQIDRLRQAAASREKLEREIVATFDRETAAARAESDAEIVAVKEAHARESGAARRALEEAIRNAEKLVADDRSRLAQQRKDKAAEINRTWKNDTR